jgi:drug/metabolite transporter (DMT)-like permease
VGVAMVIASGMVFAVNGTVSKLLLLGGFDAPQLTAFRAAGGCAGLLLVLLVTHRPAQLTVRRPELPRLIAFGLTGFFLVPMLYFVAIRRMPVGIGLLFEYMGPAFVALWVRFGEHRPVRRRLWVGLAFCLGGLACVAQVWAGRLSLDPVGVAAGLACAIFLAGYYVLGSQSVAQRDPISVTWWAFGFSALAGAIVRPWWDFPTRLLSGTSHGVPMWLLAGYFVVFGTIVAYLLVSASMRHLPPTSVGIVGMIEPVLASGFAWITLGEILVPAQIFGGLVVLVGVLLAETARPTYPDHLASINPDPNPAPDQPAFSQPPEIPTI